MDLVVERIGAYGSFDGYEVRNVGKFGDWLQELGTAKYILGISH